jgi:hypothetical protein
MRGALRSQLCFDSQAGEGAAFYEHPTVFGLSSVETRDEYTDCVATLYNIVMRAIADMAR